MRGYFSIFTLRSKVLFQYRAATAAGALSQLAWGFIKVMIFSAFFAMSSSSQPISLAQAISFVWISQALLRLIPWDVDKEIEEQIRTGDFVYELVRPLHLYGLWFSRSLALRLIPTLLRAVFVLLVSYLFFGLEAPHSFSSFLYFVASCGLAILFSASLTAIILISFLWTICGEGLKRLLPNVMPLFSGLLIPLPLFPDWVQWMMNIQPFRVLFDIPCRIYTGVILPVDAPSYLVFQLVWTVVCMGFGLWLISRGLKRVIVQGG